MCEPYVHICAYTSYREMTVLLKCNPVKSDPEFTANGEPERLTYVG